jgi:segregation and condensation protein B
MADTGTPVQVKSVVEALLFASERPLLLEAIRKALDGMDAGTVNAAIAELNAEYESQNRGVRIAQVAGGFQMIASPHCAPFLRKLFKGAKGDRLSKPALETLAIIAYKQPVTRLEIESLRKVNCDSLMAGLLDKCLVRVIGRKKAPGNPKVYGTTREFLEYFGLRSLDDLPKIEDFLAQNERVSAGEIPASLPQEAVTEGPAETKTESDEHTKSSQEN